MKQLSMIIAAMAIAIGCHESKELSDTADIVSLQNVGEQIPLSTGKRWMEIQRNTSASGREGMPYAISKENLLAVTESVAGLVGLVFHYGIDDAGEKRLLVVPVDASLKLWGGNKMVIDANVNAPVDAVTAQRWTDRFKAENPIAIRFHFFGRLIFDEITALLQTSPLEIEPALNDALEPQLLLIVWNDGAASGRTDSEEAAVFDASNPCPPYCNVE